MEDKSCGGSNNSLLRFTDQYLRHPQAHVEDDALSPEPSLASEIKEWKDLSQNEKGRYRTSDNNLIDTHRVASCAGENKRSRMDEKTTSNNDVQLQETCVDNDESRCNKRIKTDDKDDVVCDTSSKIKGL